MPLWEGFDELYHYGCVQHLATARTFPVIGSTMLSRELWTSLDYLPVSHYIQPYTGRLSTSLDEYFHLAPNPRSALRRGADSMDRAWRTQPPPHATYEAMQAPLTYFLLAPVEGAREWATRHTCVGAALGPLLYDCCVALGRHTPPGATARLVRADGGRCLFVVFSCQMLYAETCRIGNDGLAAPWLLFFLDAPAHGICATFCCTAVSRQ